MMLNISNGFFLNLDHVKYIHIITSACDGKPLEEPYINIHFIDEHQPLKVYHPDDFAVLSALLSEEFS